MRMIIKHDFVKTSANTYILLLFVQMSFQLADILNKNVAIALKVNKNWSKIPTVIQYFSIRNRSSINEKRPNYLSVFF